MKNLKDRIKNGIKTTAKAMTGLAAIAALNSCISTTYKSLAYIEADRGHFDTAAKAYAVGDVMQSFEQYDNHEQTMAAIRESQQPRQNQQSKVRQEATVRRNPLYDKLNNLMEPARREGISLFLWEDTDKSDEVELDVDRFLPADTFYSGEVIVFWAKILPRTTNTIQLRDLNKNKILILKEGEMGKEETIYITHTIGVDGLSKTYENENLSGVREYNLEIANGEEIRAAKKLKIDFRPRK